MAGKCYHMSDNNQIISVTESWNYQLIVTYQIYTPLGINYNIIIL